MIKWLSFINAKPASNQDQGSIVAGVVAAAGAADRRLSVAAQASSSLAAAPGAVASGEARGSLPIPSHGTGLARS